MLRGAIISDVIVIVIILFDYYNMVQRLQRTHDHIDFINYINYNFVFIILFSSIVIRHISHKPLVVYNTSYYSMHWNTRLFNF